MALGGWKIINVGEFRSEDDREIRQSIRDLDVATMAPQAMRVGGRRLRMARGITVDPGATDNVIPRRMVKGKSNRIRPSNGSRAGVRYLSASSARIPNVGECDFHFQTKDGNRENYTFQIAEVNKALCALSKLVDFNNQVVFD